MKAIIFDLDGTLVYTEKTTRQYLVNKALYYFDVEFTDEEVDTFWFMHNRNSVLEKFNINIDKFWDIFNNKKMVKERLKHTHPFDDVDYLLELQKRGIKDKTLYSKIFSAYMDTHLEIAMDALSKINSNWSEVSRKLTSEW